MVDLWGATKVDMSVGSLESWRVEASVYLTAVLKVASLVGLWVVSNDGMKKLEELERNKVLFSNNPFSASLLYADLQNPLLIKYTFDPSDFIRGAEHAYMVVQKAVGSNEFYNYSNG